MGIDDLFGFDEEKYSRTLHSKYPTLEALQANEKKKSAQIAAATGGTAASGAAGFVVGPAALIGVGLSGRNLSIAKQKRNLIRKALKKRYGVEKTSMTDKMFFKNAGLAVGVKALTLGAACGVDDFCVSTIPPVIDAAPHGFVTTATAIAQPEHYLEGIKGGVMSQLHAAHTLTHNGSPNATAQYLAYGPTGDNAYLAGAVTGNHAARGAEKGIAKLAIKGGSKLVSSRLNNPTTPRSKPTTSKSTTKPTIAPTAAKAIEEHGRRRKTGRANATPKQGRTVTNVQPTVKSYPRTQKQLKRQPHLCVDDKRKNGMANWIIATCVFIPLVATAFFAPSLFGIWLTVISKVVVGLLLFVRYALFGIAKSAMVILIFVGYLAGVVVKSVLTIVLPNVISFVWYGLVKAIKAIGGIFNFIGYLLASIVSFAPTRSHS